MYRQKQDINFNSGNKYEKWIQGTAPERSDKWPKSDKCYPHFLKNRLKQYYIENEVELGSR